MSICKICRESWKQLSQLIMGRFLVNTVKSYHLKFKIEKCISRCSQQPHYCTSVAEKKTRSVMLRYKT